MSLPRHPLLLSAFFASACFACTSVSSSGEPSSTSPSSVAGDGEVAGGGAAGAPAAGADSNGAPIVGGGAGAAAAAAGATGSNPTAALPGAVSGSYGGAYRVPVTADLTAAATFDVTELTWTVAGGVATLSYNLPRALVGKLVRVVFTGPFDPATGSATLTGAAGTSQCTITASTISCAETMQGLVPLAPRLDVVQALAVSYPGPAADRIAVATQFAGDPIGVAELDLQRPGVAEPIDPTVDGPSLPHN